MAILKLDKDDEDREIEFELDYLTSLSTGERFQMMFQKTQEMLSLLSSPRESLRTATGSSTGSSATGSSATGKRNEHRKTTEIIKREPG